jgi:Ca2+-binding RTX toxin-like protein
LTGRAAWPTVAQVELAGSIVPSFIVVTKPTDVIGVTLPEDPIFYVQVADPTLNGDFLTFYEGFATIGKAIVDDYGPATAVISIQPSVTIDVGPDENGDARGIWNPGFGGAAVTNFGAIHVHGTRVAIGIDAYSVQVSYFNYGTIAVDGPGAVGMASENIGFFENDGLIRATASASGNEADGVVMFGPYSTFSNHGTIIAENMASNPEPNAYTGVNSVGVWIRSDAWGRPDLLFHNSGLISGEISLKVESWPQGYPADPSVQREFFNDAGGDLRGRVDLGDGGDILSNRGLIEGNVDLGPGDDSYGGAGPASGPGGGVVTGMVSGGQGDDFLLGSEFHDYLQGNQGNDTIEGGLGGNDWLVGGQGDDWIWSEHSDNIAYGNLGNDTLVGGDGHDLLRGGQGDDSIAGGAGAEWISGDRGDDTISGGTGADTFHSSSGAGLDRVTDFNATEGDRVQLDAGTTYTVSQVGSDTVIDMGNGDKLILVGVQASTLPQGWIFTL